MTRQASFSSVPQKKKIVIFLSTLWKLYSNLTFKAHWEPSLKKKMTSSGNAGCLSLCKRAVLYFSFLRTRNTLTNPEKAFL